MSTVFDIFDIFDSAGHWADVVMLAIVAAPVAAFDRVLARRWRRDELDTLRPWR